MGPIERELFVRLDEAPQHWRLLRSTQARHLWECLRLAHGNDDMRQTIYFAQSRLTGLVKIGITSDLRRRMAGLRAATGGEVDLLFVFRGELFLEKACHYTFRRQRTVSEWFTRTGLLACFIDEVSQFTEAA